MKHISNRSKYQIIQNIKALRTKKENFILLYITKIKLLIENKLIICAFGNVYIIASQEKNSNLNRDSNHGPPDF